MLPVHAKKRKMACDPLLGFCLDNLSVFLITLVFFCICLRSFMYRLLTYVSLCCLLVSPLVFLSSQGFVTLAHRMYFFGAVLSVSFIGTRICNLIPPSIIHAALTLSAAQWTSHQQFDTTTRVDAQIQRTAAPTTSTG